MEKNFFFEIFTIQKAAFMKPHVLNAPNKMALLKESINTY
jgi:hypothetical protein